MTLTPAQLPTFKTAIAANTAQIPAGQPWTGAFAGVQVNNVPNNSDGNTAIAGWYNLIAAPDYTIWKKNVSMTEIGDKFNGTELAGLTSLNHTRLQTVSILSSGGVNPSLADRRAFFDDIFSGAGGVNTRAALLILWKKLANNIQKLFSTGTGSDAVPATLAVNLSDTFTVSLLDVEKARALP